MKVWERQPREGAQTFAAFSKYLDLGPDRTLAAVAREFNFTDNKIRTIARKWNWKDRSAAWEEFLAEAQRQRAKKILENDAEKWARRRVELREKEYTLSEKLMAKANDILDIETHERQELDIVTVTLQSGEEVNIPTTIIYKPLKVSVRDASSALSTASQLMRISSEMETSRDRLDINISDEDKKLARAQAALKSIRDDMIGKLIREHPELVPEAMRRITIAVAESFGVTPDMLEPPEIVQGKTQPIEPPKPRLLQPTVEDSSPPLPDSEEDIIEAEYEDLNESNAKVA